MVELGKLARLIRSKNAGPFVMTLDIMFSGTEEYRRVVESKVIGNGLISELYGVPEEDVRIFEYAAANAIKISIPRRFIQGDVADGDMMGGQQYSPLVKLQIP